MNRKVLWVFATFTIITVVLIGMIICANVFETSANTRLLGVLALLSNTCGVLVFWFGLLFEEEIER